MNDRKWKTLSIENISPSKWFPLERHAVQLPNGVVLDDFFISTLGDVPLILALTQQNEIVLVEQYKHGIGEMTIELPGGMRQPGTTIQQSAINELEEETGIKVTASELIPLGKTANSPTKTNQITYGYAVFNTTFNSSPKPDPTEDIRILTYPAPKVLQMVLNGEIWAVDSAFIILLAAARYPDIFHL